MTNKQELQRRGQKEQTRVLSANDLFNQVVANIESIAHSAYLLKIFVSMEQQSALDVYNDALKITRELAERMQTALNNPPQPKGQTDASEQ